MTLTSTDSRVVSFFSSVTGRQTDSNGRFIGSAKSTTGYLYVTADYSVQVVLPMELLDYANAASGTMSGNRPVGIRAGSFSSASRAADEVSRIFSSVEALTKFLNSSECDATAEYDPTKVTMAVSKAKQIVAMLDSRPVKDAFYDAGYDFTTVKTLRSTYGDKTVNADWAVLTLGEFKSRYALA
jgi:hypothetical protein